jgi:hypothetical protein
MPEKEYGEERTLAGWVKMAHPTLPDNDPINVLESAVLAKESRGWFVLEFAAEQDTDGSSWQLTEDED